MELTILCLAWFGLIIVVILSVLTISVWLEMLVERLLKIRGLVYATNFWIGMILKTRCKTAKSAGQMLYLRYSMMKVHEPEVAKAFEEDFIKFEAIKYQEEIKH